MRAKLIITAAIDPENFSLAEFETDMLLLGRFQDGGSGPVQVFDDRANGQISRFLQSKQFTGKVKEKWGKLTDDDLQVIGGQQDQLVGRIQERYGVAKEEAQKQVKNWVGGL